MASLVWRGLWLLLPVPPVLRVLVLVPPPAARVPARRRPVDPLVTVEMVHIVTVRMVTVAVTVGEDVVLVTVPLGIRVRPVHRKSAPLVVVLMAARTVEATILTAVAMTTCIRRIPMVVRPSARDLGSVGLLSTPSPS